MNQIWNSIRDFKLEDWWSYKTLTNIVPPVVWKFQWVYVGLIGLCLVIAIVVAFLKIRATLKNRILACTWTNILLGGALFTCRYYRIPYLGSDILRLIQEVALIFWVNSIVLYSRTKYQDEKLAEKVQERRDKYLPKAKAS